MRIILHGGYPGYFDQAGSDDSLFAKLIDAARQVDGRILVSCLAQEDRSKLQFLGELKQSFARLDSEIEICIADRLNFESIFSDFKVWFIQGGNPTGQIDFLSSFSQEALISGKSLIAGSSSGAMALCERGYSRRLNEFLDGKAILPFSVIPHANTWPVQKGIDEFRKLSRSPLILLDEIEMVEFDVSHMRA